MDLCKNRSAYSRISTVYVVTSIYMSMCLTTTRQQCYQIQGLARVHEPGTACYGAHSQAWEHIGLNHPSSDGIIAAPLHVGTLFSDHAVVICHLTAERPKSTSKQRIYRRQKSIDMTCFIDDIGTSLLCLNPPEDLDALVNCYSNTLSSVLNQHAPLQSRSIPIRSRAPWFNEDIKNGKCEKRKAERRWRSSRKLSDLSLLNLNLKGTAC